MAFLLASLGKAQTSLALLSLAAEVVEADHAGVDAEAVEEVEDRLGHHGRTAEVVLDVLRCLVLLQVGVALAIARIACFIRTSWIIF